MSALAIYDPLTAPEGGPLFKEATCRQMAATYVRCQQEIIDSMRNIDNQCRMLNAAFHPPDSNRYYASFGLGFTIEGGRSATEESILRRFKITGWRVLVERLGILHHHRRTAPHQLRQRLPPGAGRREPPPRQACQQRRSRGNPLGRWRGLHLGCVPVGEHPGRWGRRGRVFRVRMFRGQAGVKEHEHGERWSSR